MVLPAYCVGKRSAIWLHATRCRPAIRRDGGSWASSRVFDSCAEGDVVILAGTPEAPSTAKRAQGWADSE